MKSPLVFLVLACITAVHSNAGVVATADRGDITSSEIVTYKKTPQGELQLHIFNPPGHTSTDRSPAVVFFFGGGWVKGGPKAFYQASEYLAMRGMVAISAEYRIKNKHGTTPIESVYDAKSAMRWVRSHAAELGIDPDRIVAGGGSAGGHIAANTPNEDVLNEPGEDTSVSSRPSALLLFNPVLDVSPKGFASKLFGDAWQEASPMQNIDADTPPTIIFFGDQDRLLPMKMAQEYVQHMNDAGARCELRVYEGQGHGFFVYNKSPEHFALTLIEADKFLAELGYIEGEPTLKVPKAVPVESD